MEYKRESKGHSLHFIHTALSRMDKVCTQAIFTCDRWGQSVENNRKRTPSIGGKRALRRLVARQGEAGNGAGRRTNNHRHWSEADGEHEK